MTESADRNSAEAEHLARPDAALRDRPVGGARHDRVEVGLVPHVERAGRARADGDEDQRREAAITGLIGPGATTMPTSAVNTTSDITRGLSSSK